MVVSGLLNTQSTPEDGTYMRAYIHGNTYKHTQISKDAVVGWQVDRHFYYQMEND